jgi:GT2 family glycosyltransferase
MIICDNASPPEDGSSEAISEMYGDGVRLVKSNQNLGFAVANNRAAEIATGRYLLLLNSDTIVLDGAIDSLVAFADKLHAAGILGGRTLFKKGNLNPSSCWGRLEKMGFMSPLEVRQTYALRKVA